MRSSFNFHILGFLLFLTVGCKLEAEPIAFGNDQCHYCKMNIVDKQHASQYVTSKGKQYKFDAIECMVNDLRDENRNPAITLVTDHNTTTMIPAETASYLVSPAIRSPMGANLSAFSTPKDAQEALTKYQGKIYKWSELSTQIGKQPK